MAVFSSGYVSFHRRAEINDRNIRKKKIFINKLRENHQEWKGVLAVPSINPAVIIDNISRQKIIRLGTTTKKFNIFLI